MSTEFSRTLALLRQERGVSQRTASKDLGISQALLSHYENGIREPGLSFVVKVCDYYHVSADYMLGRTLARDGSMLTSEEILNTAEPGNVLQGGVLATLQSKLLSGAIAVLFGQLGKLGNKRAINAAANCLGSNIYQLYRHLHHAAGGSDSYFSLSQLDCAVGLAGADQKLMECDFAQALYEEVDKKTAFPDMSHEGMNATYPGRNQSMTQVLGTADQRIANLCER